MFTKHSNKQLNIELFEETNTFIKKKKTTIFTK